MRPLLLTLMLALLLPLNAWGRSVEGTFTWSFDLSDHPSGKETRLWIPYPTSDASQLVTDLHWEGDYTVAFVTTDQAHGNAMLFVRWDEERTSRKLVFRFHVRRDEQSVRGLKDTGLPLDPGFARRYLGATRLGPIDGPVKALADSIVKGKSSILAKARAIYDWTVENTFRDPATRGCGLGDVPALLKRPGGKCADISSIFVSLARAAGVPAREILGIRQGRKDGQDVTGWQHCWAEFYLPATGWIPVDPADVRKAMLKQNLKLDDPKVADLRAYFWGTVDPFRVRLAQERDLVLNPPQQGPALNYLMYPFAQVGEETLDWLDPNTFRYRFTWNQN